MNTLIKKLLIKPGKSWLFYNIPMGYMDQLKPSPDGLIAHFDLADSFDGIQFFSRSRSELAEQLKIIAPLIKTDTLVWVCYPKKNSGISTDLAMGAWDMLAPYGLDAVANMAIDDVWTGVRIRLLGQRKTSGICSDEIRDNEYGKYIDVDNKVVTPPPDVLYALESQPDARHAFNKLTYSNRKEYVLWILMAKQEKTRNDRLEKMVEKLVAGKKTPSEK